MKNLIFAGIFTLLIPFASFSQTAAEQAVTKTINAFAKAADTNDVALLENYLDSNFRVVMNRLFGSTEVSIMPREVYVEKIRSKEFGGDSRKVTINNLLVNSNSAMAKVTFEGTKMTFISLLSLVKSADGYWTVIEDVPMLK